MTTQLPQNVGLRTRVAELTGLPAGQVVAIGVAAVALTPIVLPVLRPVLKATIKTGVTAFDRTKHAIAETGEILADIAAEAKAEARADSLKAAAVQLGSTQSAANEN